MTIIPKFLAFILIILPSPRNTNCLHRGHIESHHKSHLSRSPTRPVHKPTHNTNRPSTPTIDIRLQALASGPGPHKPGGYLLQAFQPADSHCNNASPIVP